MRCTLEELNLLFVLIEERDIPVLSRVMKRAFNDDARKHLGQPEGGPPGYDDGGFFHTWLLPYEESVGYKIMTGGKVIGGFIIWDLPEGHNILGTIFVDPAYQDLGVGQRAWNFIETRYQRARSWRLATPTWAEKNHHFYKKCGFVEVETDPLIPVEEGVTIYRKEINPAESPAERIDGESGV